MKKIFAVTFTIVLCGLLVCVVIAQSFHQRDEAMRVVGPYEGNSMNDGEPLSGYGVDVTKDAYRIGANKFGMPVFADPDAAYEAMKKECELGIKVLQEANDLPDMSKRNLGLYAAMVADTQIQDEGLMKNAAFIGAFYDIYENSFAQENTQAENAIENADDKVNEFDFENTYAICRAFLERYYEAAMCGKRFNSGELVTNKNLQKYVQLKLEYGKYVNMEKSAHLSYGLSRIEWHPKQNYAFLEVITEVEGKETGGFSETHQFIIGSQNKKLFIADWYTKGLGTPACLDDTVRGVLNEINDPKVWENDKAANKILKKAEKH